ncbi:uncharacterized protein YpiB (UPF0302 family) [Pullulanibacillus pueri]|uniref:IDEAL domain-containing protein n=1 Tax=Pullulanibacillus pueri TaxID=1437324 RepID=A0A8J2ZV40_9BACL|nr:IDEAL domain-containing protein [Pullulanibacillus pueri]MBM7682314.1 uncharacterized protein YpiB (UPF0302 family) [Pullulanibacillus pueri]GGH80830.1 hypothetical protein GCM10007096_17820 [Pullulanibacillus pueri]
MKSERSREQFLSESQQSQASDKLVSIDKDYAKMVLDSLYVKSAKEQLLLKIDEALDCRDRETFMTLSEKYRQLMR